MDVFTELVNKYNSWIGFFSLLFSVFVFWGNGSIKKNIKSILQHNDFEKQRNEVLKSLRKNIKSICDNIEEDRLFDACIISEIEGIVGALDQYKKVLPLNVQFDLFWMKFELRKKANKINQKLLCNKLSYLEGALKHSQTYIG